MGHARSTGDPSQQGLLPEVYHTASTGRCAHLHDRMLSKPTNYQQRTNPRSCAWVVFIAGDTLHQQPMGAGHMTVLQLCGPMGSRALPWWLFIAGDTLCHQPMRTDHMTVLQLCRLMEFRVLQWCHPMLASTTRTSCCTRMITLYGARKWIQARALSLIFVFNQVLWTFFSGLLWVQINIKWFSKIIYCLLNGFEKKICNHSQYTRD